MSLYQHTFLLCQLYIFLNLYAGWSLASVKQALSHLRWQRDRLDHLHTTVLPGGDQESPHLKICTMIVDIVSLVFSVKEQGDDYVLPDSETKLMNRVCLVRALMGQQRRAMVSKRLLVGARGAGWMYILYTHI